MVVNLRGGERCLLESSGRLVVQDVRSSDVAALGIVHDVRSSIIVSTHGEPQVEFSGARLAAISDDGATILTIEPISGSGQTHTIFVYSAASHLPVRIGEGEVAALSQDGTLVAFMQAAASSQRLLILPVGAGEPREIHIEGYHFDRIFWMPDHRRLALAGRRTGDPRPKGFMLSLIDGSLTQVTPPGALIDLVSPDGKRVLINKLGIGREALDLESGRTQKINLDREANACAWLADSRSILFTERNFVDNGKNVFRYDTETGTTTQLRRIEGRGSIGEVLVTPDGRHCAYDQEETNSTLYLIRDLADV